METFRDSVVYSPHMFNQILQLLVEITTTEVGGTNSTLKFPPQPYCRGTQSTDKLRQPKQGETFHP